MALAPPSYGRIATLGGRPVGLEVILASNSTVPCQFGGLKEDFVE
jgi:hypothetical protein